MNKLLLALLLFLLSFSWIKVTASDSCPAAFPWKAQWINTERCQSATNTWLIYRKSFAVGLEKRTFSFRDLLRSGRYRPLPDKGHEYHRRLALAFRERWFQSYQQWESRLIVRGDRPGVGDRLRRELAVRLV